ncbi:hypothetical protein FKP32DRAFT_1558742, partial [Trametes sanguinea]
LLDMRRRVVGVLAGRPDDPSWSEVAAQASAALEAILPEHNTKRDHGDHRRGGFIALACGVSFGGGQKTPGRLVNTSQNAKALASLCEHAAFKRIAGFGSSALATYAPKIYQHMQHSLGALYHALPSLRPNFVNSVYPAATFNFGPRTVSFPHTDSANAPFNFCHIAALGRFNPKAGGHMVLLDYRIVIEFPPGSSILIPSAIVRHGNTAIQPGEVRQSFTQYCAGGLLRWVDAGFRSQAEFAQNDPAGKARFDREADIRVTKGLGMFSTYDSLIEDVVGM